MRFGTTLSFCLTIIYLNAIVASQCTLEVICWSKSKPISFTLNCIDGLKNDSRQISADFYEGICERKGGLAMSLPFVFKIGTSQDTLPMKLHPSFSKGNRRFFDRFFDLKFKDVAYPEKETPIISESNGKFEVNIIVKDEFESAQKAHEAWLEMEGTEYRRLVI